MDEFKVLTLLGSGTYSNVYEGIHLQNGEHVALKRIKSHSMPSTEDDGS